MSDEFYNRLTLSDEGNRTVFNNSVDSRSHRHGCQYSAQPNTSEVTAANSRPYRIDNRVERTEVNLHLKHRTQRRSTASESASSRGRHRANDQNRHLKDESRTYHSNSTGKYEGEEKQTPVFSNVNECDSGTVLDRGYMPEIPRATPASTEQAVVLGAENTKALMERMNSYVGSEWDGANLASSLTSYNYEEGSYANYTQPSSKQAQLCPHVKGQQQESLREDNNNLPCVSFTDRDDKRYNSNSVKHHLATRYSDRYVYHPGERPYRPDGPPSYYYGIHTENTMRWKNNNREKNGRQIPGAYGKNEKHGLSKSLPKNSRYTSASDRNVNSSDSESGPSSSEREYWPNSYCPERRKKRVRKKGDYRSKHYLGVESDPSEHSDPGHRRNNEAFPNHICCSSADCEYEQQRSRKSVYGLNNRRNISRSLTSVSSIDDESGSFRTGFTFNRISPRGRGKARISKINIKSFSTVQLNSSRTLPRATSSTSDIVTHDETYSRLYHLENVKQPRKTSKDNSSLSDSSCTSPSLKKSPFNTRIRGRKSSTSGGETPSTTPVPRICSPEIVDDKFQAPPSSSFKAIHTPGDDELNTSTSTDEGAKVLNLIENLERDVESEEDPDTETDRPELMLTGDNTENDLDIDDVTSPDSVALPTTSNGLLFSSEDDFQTPLTPGGVNRVSSFPFGKDTPYSIQKPFVTLVNIQEEDEAVHSDGSSSHVRRRRESVTRRKMSKENQTDTGTKKETEGSIPTSPLRRPSYVYAQNSSRISPSKQEDEKIVEGSRTKPNGKEQHVYCDNVVEKHSVSVSSITAESETENVRQKEGTTVNDDNGNSRRRSKKAERPRIPTILNLDKALDELFDDVENQQTSANAEPKKCVSRQESAPQLTNSAAVSDVNRETRKRSNSIDNPSAAVKLIASEADSTYMQRADGKVERRHENNKKSEIDKSLELLDELVVELSEKQPGRQVSERPALSRNVDGKSAGSASDVVMSPSPSQTSINSEKSTSGSEHIDKDVGVSPLSDMYPSRYHSDPTPRVKEDYTTIQETIAEYDIKPRNSNSEPAINGKLLEQAADLAKAKAAEKENANAEHKNSIEHATSSPADLTANAQPQQKLRRRESEKARRRQAAKVAAQIEANAKEASVKHGDDDISSGGKSNEQPEHHTWPRQTKTEPETGEAPTGKKKKATKSEMRWHVVQNLIETEQSYVQSLQYLVKEYMNPLRKSDIVEAALVNEMFYQIPEILKYHEVFLKHLDVRVHDWSNHSKLGDIFVSSFTNCLLVDAYSQFISNFLRAKTAIRSAERAKPGFVKYCEQRSRDHKEKLTLHDLMIMPVQRIPRYVLIITDLLKYTPGEHPDHGNLLSALGEIKTLAERMNKGEQEVDQAEKEAERLRDLEASIEGITGLVLPRRKYKRQDLVAEMKGGLSKKDRCLFLFSDLLVCATVKRKQTSLRRGSLSLFSGQSAAEMNKYRLLWQSPLNDVELVTTDGDLKSLVKNSADQANREKLELDLNTVSTISKLTESVSIPHQALDDAIRDLASELNQRLVDSQRSTNATFMSHENTVVLNIGSREAIENYNFVFLSKEIKSSWEAYFLDAKQQLAYTKDSSPNFQSAIPINKSRSGLQFTCASPTVAPRLTKRGTHCGTGDVWVASSDGCVGQVSMLSPLREFEQGTTYSPCQARILSISPVPGWKLAGIHTTNVEYDFKDPAESNNSTLRSKSSGYNSDDNMPSNRRSVASTTKAGREEIIAFDSSTDDDDIGEDSYTVSPSPPSFDGRLSPEGSSLGTAGSLDGDLSSDTRDDSDYHENPSSEDESKSRQRSGKKGIEGHCEDEENQQPTVWMGAEDGYIYIFPVTSAVKQRRNKTKIQKGSPVQCILYVDNQVFVGLANGDLCVYKRSANYTWEINAPRNITISSNARINCMTAVLGRVWVGCNNQVVVINTTTLEMETRFNASMDSSRSLHAIASSGMGVWISIQSLSVIRLYHASTCEHLADVDTKDAVHKMLAGSDAIIKQHKAACLRVTALLTCKDLLWIGTSAGVVLTLPLPIIAPNATSVQAPLDVTASPQGHTGHVRFLTAVEMGKGEEKDETSSNQPANRSPRRLQLNIEKANLPFPTENIFIISGGDGYEDFKSTANESAGREDSTNHLLIWKV